MPVLVATATAAAVTGVVRVVLMCTLLVACVLMQAAVNTFNDYFDYVKGTDSAEDNVDPSDAVLVYNNVNPSSVLALGIGFVVAAFAFGIYSIVVAGWVPLVIAVIGALAVVLYSGGRTPISYLPIGEVVSGVVMGGLIFLACYYAYTRTIGLAAVIWAVPTIIGVALIMMTNNVCDIEKDIDASRRTLPVRIGRVRTRRLYHILVAVWIVAIVAIVAIWFTCGLIIAPFMLLASYPFLNVLWKNPLDAENRISAMSQICVVNVVLGAFYAASALASSAASVVA